MSNNPEEWRKKALNCQYGPETINYHDWIPIAYHINQFSKNVSTMMCGKCFHEINISEAFENRIKL
jgi:hypothetical protein